MSKGIWHKLPEQPEKGRDVLEKWHHLGIHYTHFVAKNGIAEDNPFTDAWCYLDDLLALEPELDRTRKVLDRAKWWLNEIVENHRYTPISTAEIALKEITALEQKEHFADASKTIEQKDVK